MCGLVGACGFLEYKHKQMMRDLFFLNTLRGKDSTGLSAVSRDKMVSTRKMTIPGYEFIEYPIVDKAMKFADQVWIGHGRYKTTGDINRANAHPFEVLDDEGDILLVGAHNGTLSNKWDIDRRLKGDKFDTDSEAIFNLLVEAPDYKKAIAELKGAWSLVWYDPTTDSVHFCRNDQRPMNYAFTKDHKVLVWASEAWMIINAARRNGVELLQNDKGFSCFATLPDYLYTMAIPQERDKELPDIVREGGYVGAPANNFQAGMRRFQNWWDEDGDGSEIEPKGTAQAPTREKETKTNGGATEKTVVTIGYPETGRTMRGFNNEVISLEEFKKIREKGCGWCQDKIEEGLVFAFLNEDSLVCVRCMHDTHDKGNCVHGDDIDEEEDFLNDDIPFDLTDKGRMAQEGTKEHKRLMATAVQKIVG